MVYALGGAPEQREPGDPPGRKPRNAQCTDAGVAEASVVQRQGTVHFASTDALVSTERACVWTLGGVLDDAQFERLRREAHSTFLPFVDAGGMIAFAMPALLITTAKR
jgi:hypothetical protein